MIRTLTAAALALLVSLPATAATYELEKPHTQILFFVSHLGFSTSSGRFLDFDGSFEFDEADMSKSSANITIKTASIEMNHGKWNDHMKNEDFFDVTKYPTMTFRSTSVEAKGDGQAVMHGDLTMLDQTHPVSLTVSFNGSGQHPFNPSQTRAGFELRGELKRSQWGMKYGIPAVGNTVELRISAEGIKQ